MVTKSNTEVQRNNRLALSGAWILAALWCSSASADEIWTSDGQVQKGKILAISATHVEYDPEGDIPFLILARSEVVKITYDNGKTVVFPTVQPGNGAPSSSPAVSKEAAAPGELPPAAEKTADITWAPEPARPSVSKPPFLLGFGLGFNNLTGLGVVPEYYLNEVVSIFAGAGLGLWGFRMGGGARYGWERAPYGFSLGGAYSYSTGSMDTPHEYAIEVENAAGEKSSGDLKMNLNPIHAIHVFAGYAWQSGKDNRVLLEFGLTLPLGTPLDNATPQLPAGSKLTNQGKDELSSLAPSGFLLSLSYAFGFGG